MLAFSAGGGVADGFPIRMPTSSSTQPLVASADIFISGNDGYIYAFQPRELNQQSLGFPLAVGARITATPLIIDDGLYAVDGEGGIKAWRLENSGDVWWGQQYGGSGNTSFVEWDGIRESGIGSRTSALLIPEENYNWPNPIREGETYFRVAPSQDVRVTITIIDAAGGLIDTLVAENVRGATTTDILWQTDAASGLYFARMEAVAADGSSETKLIRIAIVR